MDEDYIATVVPAQIGPGLYVNLQVHDTGLGMSQETVNRVLDPFFTTKFTGRGLGLAAVLGIVRGHRGAIKIYSTPGQGTTFKVLLPASEQHAVKSGHQPAVERREAVDLYQVLADKIDVVLLDMTMPVLGGEETFR